MDDVSIACHFAILVLSHAYIDSYWSSPTSSALRFSLSLSLSLLSLSLSLSLSHTHSLIPSFQNSISHFLDHIMTIRILLCTIYRHVYTMITGLLLWIFSNEFYSFYHRIPIPQVHSSSDRNLEVSASLTPHSCDRSFTYFFPHPRSFLPHVILPGNRNLQAGRSPLRYAENWFCYSRLDNVYILVSWIEQSCPLWETHPLLLIFECGAKGMFLICDTN